MGNNRKSTKGRMKQTIAVKERRKTKFGDILVPTNRVKVINHTPGSNDSAKMAMEAVNAILEKKAHLEKSKEKTT